MSTKTLKSPKVRVPRHFDPAAKLQEQIDHERKTIKTDAYPISVGELSSLYKENELDIHPEFQRFYRWDDERKSKFIESMLLGIPIPSIFVSQTKEGTWDVVDGLQRLSTIFQFMGILRDEKDVIVAPLVLTRTKYLPAMDGMQWEEHGSESCISDAQRLFIKRAKLDVKIILRESDEKTKFELFQRLNTGGAELSEQEIRNAMLVAANAPFFAWLKNLAGFEPFRDCTALSDRPLEEQFNLELVLRFLVFRCMPSAQLKSVGDLGDFLTEQMMEFSAKFDEKKNAESDAFKKTFAYLAATVGPDAFRKFDGVRSRFSGGFLISGFEVVACGIGHGVYNAINLEKEDLLKRIKSFWADKTFVDATGSGIRASTRIPKTIHIGRKLFTI